MKLFAIYSKVELIKKPDWLDAFCIKYGSLGKYHVTLKQTCLLQEADVPAVKDRLFRLFDAHPVSSHEITLSFTNLVIDRDTDGTRTLMINATSNPTINALQKQILAALSLYRNYTHPESRIWETHFQPHITIASNLHQEQYAQALTEIGDDRVCEGVILDVALIIVDTMVPEEADKPENQTIYPL